MRLSTVLRSLLVLAPIAALAAGCAASASDDAASDSDALLVKPPIVPLPPGKGLPSPPSKPVLYSVTPSASSITVGWTSPDATMDTFTVYRRDASWTWQPVHTDVNRPNAQYTWMDDVQTLSAQCYMVEANSKSTGYSSSTAEQCTLRPDPKVFPQSAPSAAIVWSGLTNKNDVAGDFSVGNQFLQQEHQDFGVSLGWGHSTGENAKPERRGLGSTWPLMRGEAIAIRIWGAGWLAYGHNALGVDVVLSDTPQYEWYVVEPNPGQPIEIGGPYALWNKSAQDFLVKGNQTWGVDLNWYEKTLPPPPGPTPPPPRGAKTFTLFNCFPDMTPLEVWVDDETAGTGWMDKGTLDTEYAPGGGCPQVGAPFRFTPVNGHAYDVRAIDFTVPGCEETIDIGTCIRSESTFVGDSNGIDDVVSP